MLFIRRKAEIEILSSIGNNLCQTIKFDTAKSSQDKFQEQGAVCITMGTSTDDQMEESESAADMSNIMVMMDNRKTVTTCGSPSGMPMISYSGSC
jgi:meiotic recombination protein SPO11